MADVRGDLGRLVNARDFVLLAMVAVMALVVRVVPERQWPSVAVAIARLNPRSRRQHRSAEMESMVALAGGRSLALPPDACAKAHLEGIYLSRLQVLRCHTRGGWRPAIELKGRNHLEAAIAAGKGAILWIAPLSFGALVTKMAFHRAGFAVSHVSRFTHGMSRTRIGVSLLNPIHTRVEARYIAERIVIGDGGPVPALRQTSRLLRRNGIVSFTIGSRAGRTEMVPFLGGEIELPTGQVELMRRTSAPLLPVFTVREADGRFTTIIEPPLEPPGQGQRTRETLARYAALLEGYVLRYPEQFFWTDGSLRMVAPAGRKRHPVGSPQQADGAAPDPG